MRRATIFALTGACAMFALAATSFAAPKGPKPARDAAKQCQAERNADRAAFRATYGQNAMRNCIRANRADSRADKAEAVQACRDEREADPDGFAETYGTNDKGRGKGKGRNAFGQCVRTKVRDARGDDVDAFMSAAKDCRAEREADPDGFLDTYGTNDAQGRGAKRNAFGKCVSSKVQEAGEGEEEPPAES